MRKHDSSMLIYADVLPDTSQVAFEGGWAHASLYGHMYGKTYIGPFKDENVAMFQAKLK